MPWMFLKPRQYGKGFPALHLQSTGTPTDGPILAPAPRGAGRKEPRLGRKGGSPDTPPVVVMPPNPHPVTHFYFLCLCHTHIWGGKAT